MKFDTEIYRELSGIQRSVQNINKSIEMSTCYYSNLLSEALRVKDMLKKINKDEYLSIDSAVEINDCWYILNKACDQCEIEKEIQKKEETVRRSNLLDSMKTFLID